MANRRRHVVEEVERLREDETIVGVRRNALRVAQVRDHAGSSIAGIDIEHVGSFNAIASVPPRQIRIEHLQDRSVNVGGVPCDE